MYTVRRYTDVEVCSARCSPKERLRRLEREGVWLNTGVVMAELGLVEMGVGVEAGGGVEVVLRVMCSTPRLDVDA